MKNFKLRAGVVGLSVIVLVGPSAAEVDTSAWVCEYCEYPSGLTGSVSAGLGHISEDAPVFGGYTGLDESGAFGRLSADLLYLSADDGQLWRLSVDDLMLDGWAMEVDGGKPGVYAIRLRHDGMTRSGPLGAQTPYTGIGSGDLSLPGGWVRAGTTAGMTALAGALRPVGFAEERQRTDVAVTAAAAPGVELRARFRRDVKEGLRPLGASFFFNSAVLPQPVDWRTDIMDLAVSYAGEAVNAELSYKLSLFRNGENALRWDNAYTALNGEDGGEFALPPDNQFHQLALSGSYRLSPTTLVSANFARGRATQDDAFLPATTNTTLTVAALPRADLGGRVDSTSYGLRLNSQLSDRLALNAELRREERDNVTSSEAYPRVAGDLFAPLATRTNQPYDFTDATARLSADYRATARTRVVAGYDRDQRTRTLQEVGETTEQTIWLRTVFRQVGPMDLTLRAAFADRDAGAYQAVAETLPTQNPLLRKHYLTGRDRQALLARVQLNPDENVSIGFERSVDRDEYPDSALGLIEGSTETTNVDISLAVADAATVYGYLGLDQIETRQVGEDGGVRWTARHVDETVSVGAGIRVRTQDKLEVGLDYSAISASGDISLERFGVSSPFPSLASRLARTRLYASNPMAEDLDLWVELVHERFRTTDWALADVTPDALANVLSLGAVEPDHDVLAAAIGVRYRF